MNTIATEMRHCPDIGMFALDRPIEETCRWATEFCSAMGENGTCFNKKLYRIYPAMHAKDKRNETAWRAIDSEAVADWFEALNRKRKDTSRVRLMTRGEAFSDYADIERVELLANATPDRLIWIPTRAWRNPLLWAMIGELTARCPNLRVLASIDPKNWDRTTPVEDREYWETTAVKDLETAGVSTMFYGDNDATAGRFKCPKTWGGKKTKKGACAVCKKGCFRNDKPVHVHLKKH